MTSSLSAVDFARMTPFAIVTIVGIGGVAWLATRPLRLDRALVTAFLLVVMFSNSGNYGLPLVLFAFGTSALAHATVYFVVNAILAYTVGVFLASAGSRPAWEALKGIARVPAMYGVAAAALVMVSGASVPLFMMRPIELMSGAALPAMILVLGMQLERGGRPARPLLVGLAAGLTLVATPLIAYLASGAFGAPGGDPAIGHAARRRHDDHRPGIRHRARVRDGMRRFVDPREPTDDNAPHRCAHLGQLSGGRLPRPAVHGRSA